MGELEKRIREYFHDVGGVYGLTGNMAKIFEEMWGEFQPLIKAGENYMVDSTDGKTYALIDKENHVKLVKTFRKWSGKT